MRYGDETAVLLEIDQPHCTRTYGTAPCAAALGVTGLSKCRNTRITCQSAATYLPENRVIRFCRSQDDMIRYGPAIPLLNDVTITPASINLGGMDRDKSPFGQRASITAVFGDGLHSDLQVDDYRLERPGPSSVSRGWESDLWRAGVTPAGYSLNQDVVGESAFAERVGPYGSREVVNVCQSLDTPAGDPGPDGGWTMNAYIPVDKAKSYLFACFFKRLSAATFTGANTFWGTGTNSPGDVILNLAGVPTVNPYFIGAGTVATLPIADKWYLLVGFVHENGYGTTDTLITGVYDPATLARISGGNEWKWDATTSATYHRAYHYYNQTISGEAQQMARPRIFECTPAQAPEMIKKLCLGGFLDPYVTGTWWTKWLARNPFHAAYTCRIYIGKSGDPLSSMRAQSYVIEKFDGPNNGAVSMSAKDLFSLVERRKAVAPLASRGSLLSDIASGAASATLTPAGIGNAEYAASGYLCIGSEIMQFTRAADALTFVARGALNTVASAHSHDDLVQTVLTFTATKAHDIAYTLLVQYSEVPVAAINKAAWDAQAVSLPDLYTAYVAEPTAVSDLVGELSEQAGFTVYPDVATGMVEFLALRAQASTQTVTDNEWVIDRSLTIKRQDKLRVSQVWVYFGQVDPTKKIDDRRNYASRYVSVDLEAETGTKYGTPAIREVFSRWIPRFGGSQAKGVSDRLLTMFLNPPVEAKFRIGVARSGLLRLARLFSLRVAEVADFDGNPLSVGHMPIEIADGEFEIGVKSQEVSLSVPPDPAVETLVHLDSPAANVTMRSVWDLLYPPPVSGQVITFQVDAGIDLTSGGTGTPVLDTGVWPAGVVFKIIVRGSVLAAGGAGGYGGDRDTTGYSGVAGLAGGVALKIRMPVSIDAAGGFNGQGFGGTGGNGGAPGQPGDSGQFGGGNLGGGNGPPGTGGAAGPSIDGIGFVTWLAHGDERGPQV